MSNRDANVGRRMLLGVVLLAVVGAAIVVGSLWLRAPRVDLPSPDLSDTPPPVQREYEVLLGELRENRQSAEHWGRVGMFLMAHHHAREAGACLRRAAELEPQEFRWRYYQAVLLEETDMCLAADLYATAVQVDGSYLPARLRYAAVLFGLNRLEEARAQYMEVIRQAPEDHHAYLGLARIAVTTADWEVAKKMFAAVIERAPSNRDAHVELGRVAILDGHVETALREHQLASRLPAAQPRAPDPLLGEVEQFEAVSRQLANEADQLMLRGDTAAAVAAFRTLIEARPEMPRPLLNLGQTLWAAGRVEEAVSVYQELVRRFPDIAEGYYNLALALET
ncbi:MAG: tetratricopeptide repeat protein, partial [Pirellulaceae bacterium]